jgi:hypothetical protein
VPDEPEDLTPETDETPDDSEIPNVGEAPESQVEYLPVEVWNQRERDLLSRLRRAGQESADARREVRQLREQLEGVNATLTRQQEDRMQAYLATLPPELRLQEEVKQLRDRLDDASKPRPMAPQETAEEYTVRRMQEIVAKANVDFGLDGGDAVTGEEPGIDLSSEQAYALSVRKVARQRAFGGPAPRSEQEDDGVAAKKPAPASNAKQETPAQMEERITKSVLSRMGVGGGSSPRPAARGGSVTSETFVGDLGTYNSKRGPREVVAKLRKHLEEAENQNR